MPKNSNANTSTYTSMMQTTSQGRPYAKNLYELFSAFIVQQPLTSHRAIFRNYSSSFTTDEAAITLANLQFSQLVSRPHPLDTSKLDVVRTTTTFNMNKDMAKALLQHFLNARLIVNAAEPSSLRQGSVKDGSIWKMTDKGKWMVYDFCQRAQVPIPQELKKKKNPPDSDHSKDGNKIAALSADLKKTSLERSHDHSSKEPTETAVSVIHLERLLDDDELCLSMPDMSKTFKTMVNNLEKGSVTMEDIIGVSTKELDLQDVFFGYNILEWVYENTSVVSREETELLAVELLLYRWIEQLLEKSEQKLQIRQREEDGTFDIGKRAIYTLTEKGKKMLNEDGAGTTFGVNYSTISKTCSLNTASTVSVNSENNGIRGNSYSLKKDESLPPLPVTAGSSDATEENANFENSIHSSTTESENGKTSNHSAFSPNHSSTSLDSPTHTNVGARPSTSATSIPLDEEHRPDLKFTVASTDNHPNSKKAQLFTILDDPLKRMCFREFLRSNHCEENISFYINYTDLIKKLVTGLDALVDETAIHLASSLKLLPVIPSSLCNTLLAQCCAIYNTYFSSDQPYSELNISDHLQHKIDHYMKSTFKTTEFLNCYYYTGFEKNISHRIKENGEMMAIGDAATVPFGSISVSKRGVVSEAPVSPSSKKTYNSSSNSSGSSKKQQRRASVRILKDDCQDSPTICIYKIVRLYMEANNHVCGIMADDSMPRFKKTDKYLDLIHAEERKKSKELSEEGDGDSVLELSSSDDEHTL